MLNATERFHPRVLGLCFLILTITTMAVNAPGKDAGLSLPPSLKPESQDRDARVYNWQQRHQAVLERNKHVKPDLVIVGDSIIHFWGGEPSEFRGRAEDSWKMMVGSHVATNLGFGWDYIDNAYYRVQNGELDGIAPKIIVILLGTNNIGGRKDSAEVCADNMRAFLDLVTQKLPRSKILLLGILPRGDAALNPVIFATNRLYSKMADGNHIYYVDLGELFLPAGSTAVSKTLMPDGVHPSAAGYELLGKGIREQLGKLGS